MKFFILNSSATFIEQCHPLSLETWLSLLNTFLKYLTEITFLWPLCSKCCLEYHMVCVQLGLRGLAKIKTKS